MIPRAPRLAEAVDVRGRLVAGFVVAARRDTGRLDAVAGVAFVDLGATLTARVEAFAGAGLGTFARAGAGFFDAVFLAAGLAAFALAGAGFAVPGFEEPVPARGDAARGTPVTRGLMPCTMRSLSQTGALPGD